MPATPPKPIDSVAQAPLDSARDAARDAAPDAARDAPAWLGAEPGSGPGSDLPPTWPLKPLSLWQVSLSKRAVLAGDLLAIGLAFALATALNVGLSGQAFVQTQHWFSTQDPQRYGSWFSLCALGLGIFLFRYQHYVNRRPFWDELSDVLWTVGCLALLDMTLVAVTRWNASRLWWALSWTTLAILIMLMRAAVRQLLQAYGLWLRPTLLIGCGQNAHEAILALRSEPHLGYDLRGFVDVDEAQATAGRSLGHADASSQHPLLDGLPQIPHAALRALALEPGVQWMLALDHEHAAEREHWLRMLSQWGAQEICVIPDMRGVPLYGTNMSYFFSHEVALLRIKNNLKRWPTRAAKRLFDTSSALVLLLLLSPLMLYLAWKISKDGGPVLYVQTRIGKRGRAFSCFKFRSMVVSADAQLEQLIKEDPELKAQWQKDHKIKADPRITPVGQWIRRTSMDELPQLLNVLKGEMSLVGPRPIVKAELERYGDDVQYFLLVRPGMTGLWQVSGRNDMDYDKRVYLDTWYVKNWSLWYDLVILFKTVSVVLNRRGAY